VNHLVDTPHVTDVDIQRFRGRQLPAADLLVFTDHVAACAECRTRLGATGESAAAARALANELEAEVDHLSEVQVHAYVDGRLREDERREIERHLAVCRSCAAEIRDLQAFADASGRRSGIRWRVYVPLAAAAAIALGVALPPLLGGLSSGRLSIALQDQPGVVGVDGSGALDGIEGLSREQQDAVRQALQSGRLVIAAGISELAGTPGTLLGDPDGSTDLRVLSPQGTAVLIDRPTLRWTAVGEPATYMVTVQDRSSLESFESPPLQATEWTPISPLPRGRTYVWQVVATTGQEEIIAPRPPAPPAVFQVIDRTVASGLEQLPASHLARGVLYAQAGALDEAEQELSALAARNPGSTVADALLDQLRAARVPPRTSAP
jgi:hypothetical protein